ncbi:hypothetical protein A9Q86_13805 [Flavobacteriales bacterium 33_180_T64]|nr:hypothetical protein A9Q86_13805 [Flavobacteriales bacterium 33_180_T64]
MTSSYIFSQNRLPPPPCNANGNSGFGGAVGEGHILFSGDGVNPINFAMSTSANDMNDILVLYIDTGEPGRNEIDTTIDDNADDHRIAISNSNVNGYGSTISFLPGFEASYAIAIDVNFGGLWSIPNTGSVGTGELGFITSVNSTLTSSTQGFYTFNFNWEDLGLTITDEFHFVGVYVSNTGYSSDEGYGEGITTGTIGSDNITFTGYLTLPGCSETLSNSVNLLNTIDAYYFNDKLFIKNINEAVTISVYDIQGRKTYSNLHQIQGSVPISLELNKNELQFIVIESSNKRKVLKVIPN